MSNTPAPPELADVAPPPLSSTVTTLPAVVAPAALKAESKEIDEDNESKLAEPNTVLTVTRPVTVYRRTASVDGHRLLLTQSVAGSGTELKAINPRTGETSTVVLASQVPLDDVIPRLRAVTGPSGLQLQVVESAPAAGTAPPSTASVAPAVVHRKTCSIDGTRLLVTQTVSGAGVSTLTALDARSGVSDTIRLPDGSSDSLEDSLSHLHVLPDVAGLHLTYTK